MAEYIVNFTDPTSIPITISPKRQNGPGSTVANTSLRLFGDGFTNWGESANENFVRLLENFMGATAPVNPVMGQMWVETKLYYYDTVGVTFYLYDAGTLTWGSIVVLSQPAAPPEVIGTYWFDTTDSTLKYFKSAYDQQPATWMVRSYDTGVVPPTGVPNYQVNVYDANVDGWGVISSVAVTDSVSAPADNHIGSLRYSPTNDTLYVWSGTAWSAMVNAANPVFTGDLDMGTNLITNLGDAVNPTDALNLQTGDLLYVNVSGDTMTGDLDMGTTNHIVNLADPVNPQDAATKNWAAPAIHSHTLANITDAGTAAAATIGTSPTNVPLVSNILGKHSIWVPAGAMVSRTTSGAGSATVELVTNNVTIKTLNFDTGTVEYAQFFVQMPTSWNELTVTARFVWSHSTGAVAFGVVWSIRAVAISSGDSLNVARGTAVNVTTTGGTADVSYQSGETAALTIAGTPAAHDMVLFEVYRSVADGSDTLGIDARLHGISIYYTTDALTDA